LSVAAAEELIEHLMTEKEELLGQVHHLRSELASLRYPRFPQSNPFSGKRNASHTFFLRLSMIGLIYWNSQFLVDFVSHLMIFSPDLYSMRSKTCQLLMISNKL